MTPTETAESARRLEEAMMEPVAWKYEIAAYADHRPEVGVVLNKRELSSAVPAEQITWTPLFAFDDRRIVPSEIGEAIDAAVEMIERMERIESALSALVDDLEERATWNHTGIQRVVGCGNGVYVRAKKALEKRK